MTTYPLTLRQDLDETNSVANVSYNGFRFPPARHASVSFSPEMSDDGRTQKYTRMDLRIEFVWVPMQYLGDHISTPGGAGYDTTLTTDDSFPSIRQRLNNPGQHLRFVSQGVGSFSIQDGQYYDVNNGPRPKVISETPIAGSKALRVAWECSTWFPDCLSITGFNGFSQFNYGISWGIGTNGITTRTINGSYEIALSRNPNPGSTHAFEFTRSNADEARDQLTGVFPLLKGFTRSQNFNLSPDRKRMEFSITDSEINSENPYFPGIVDTKVSRKYSSDYKNGFTIWQGMISGSLEVAPGYSKLRAWIAFASVFENIFSKRNLGHQPKTETTAPAKPGDSNPLGKESWGMITSISLEEEIYGRTLSFAIGYRLFCSLGELFKATGLFQPLLISPSVASADLWRSSMSTIQGARGWRGLQFFSSDDVIIDMCSGYTILPSATPEAPPSEIAEISSSDGNKSKGPPKEKSYIYHDSSLEASTRDGTTYSLPLQRSDPVQESTKVDNFDEIVEWATENESVTPKKPIIHRGKPTTYIFKHTGMLVRVAYAPAVPNVKTIGGINARKYGTDLIVSKVLGTGTDVDTGDPLTIYGIYWEKQYVLEDKPNGGTLDWEGEKALFT